MECSWKIDTKIKKNKAVNSILNTLRRIATENNISMNKGMSDSDYSWILSEAYERINRIFVENNIPINEDTAILYSASDDIMHDLIQSGKNAKMVPDNPVVNEDGDIDVKEEGTIGVTSVINAYGNRNNWTEALNPPMDRTSWANNKRGQYIIEKKTVDEANDLIKREEDSWDVLHDIGDDCHLIYSNAIMGMGIPSQDKLKYLDLTQANEVLKQAEEYVKIIKYRYPGCKIYTEIPIKTNKLHPEFERILRNGGISAISGRIDIIVIDADGKAHIYDLKVSRKPISTWWDKPGDHTSQVLDAWNIKENSQLRAAGIWDSTKKLQTSYQLAFYAAMLEQHGIPVASCGVVPVKLDLSYDSDGLTINGINHITRSNEEITQVPEVVFGKHMDHIRMLLGYEYKFNTDSMDKINEQMKSVFPNINIENVSSRKEATVESFIKNTKFWWKVQKGNNMYDLGYRFAFVRRELDDQWTYCKDEEDRDRKIKAYVDELNIKRMNDMGQIGKAIYQGIMSEHNVNTISNLFNGDHKKFNELVFSRYLHGGWTVINNEDLFNNGLLLFKKDDLVEIMVISNEDLTYVNRIRKGATSILGRDVMDSEVDFRDILYASNANLALMKAMFYISNNQDAFQNMKIMDIKVVNPWYSQQSSEMNDVLVENYRQLQMRNKSIMPPLKVPFVSSADSCILQADLALNAYSGDLKCDLFEILPNGVKQHEAIKYVDQLINKLRASYRDDLPRDMNKIKLDTAPGQALYYLMQAKLSLFGRAVIHENDAKDWFKGLQPGLNITSINDSSSVNVLILGNIVNAYKTHIQKQFMEDTLPWLKKMKAFYKHDMPASSVTGGEIDLFNEWIEKDSNGNIAEDFMFVRPEEFTGSEESKQALIATLELLAHYRYKGDQQKIEEAKISGEYYEIPLMKASTTRQIKQIGLKKSADHWWEEQVNQSEFALSDENSKAEELAEKEQKIFNRFDITGSARREVIAKMGVGYYERNIEDVVLNAALAYLREDIGGYYLGAMEGLKLALRFQSEIEGNKIPNIEQFVKKYINRKIYGNMIMQKELRVPYAYVNTLKQITSFQALAINPRAWTRETLQGIWINMSRSGVEVLNGVTMKSWMQAMGQICKESINNASVFSMLEQLNHICGMANYSINDMARKNRVNWLGIRNWTSETAFLTSSSPDFIHRMSILIAKMIGDGCWDAMYLDDDGFLKYDMKKDKRYSIYLSGDTSDPQYAYQKALYESNLKQFETEMNPADKNGFLPFPYTSRELATIRQYGDRMFGHYDSETKALMTDMFLGALTMQYRTFVTAKFEQWFNKPGVYNGDQQEIEKDPETGEEIWEIITYPNDDNTGIPTKELVLKSQVPADKIRRGLAQPHIVWKGWRMEGIVYTVWSGLKAIATLDQKELNAIWKDPLRKANLWFFFHDMFIMLVMNWLFIQAFINITNTKDKKELENKLRQEGGANALFYAALTGSTQDGPVYQVVGSMFKTADPPVYLAVQRIASSTGSFVNGNISGYEWASRNFGATREAFAAIDAVRSA